MMIFEKLRLRVTGIITVQIKVVIVTNRVTGKG